MSRRKRVLALVILLLVAGGAFSYFGRIEHSRKASPNGRFYEIVSIRPMYYIPLPVYRWGVHSDTPSFIEVEGLDGVSYGQVPSGLLQHAELTWEDKKAFLPARAEWDLDSRTCFYWNQNQTRKIYVNK